MASEDGQTTGPPSPSDALVEALRALVREELKRPSPTAGSVRPPTWRDGLWLLVLIVNVALFVALIPEEWWKSPALEVPGKILPWLGGGTFILGATWFRDRLLALSRNGTFKSITAVAFVPLLLLHVRFVPLRPTIDPPGAGFCVDDRTLHGEFNGNTTIRLRLAGHKFKLLPEGAPEPDPPACGADPKERVIEWSWAHLFRAWVTRRQPRWALLYALNLTTWKGSTIRITSSDGKLDTDFDEESLRRDGDSLEFQPHNKIETIFLPFGTYRVIEEKRGCKAQTREPVGVPSTEAGVDFDPMDCQ